jgi:hypothetical protein
MKILLIPEKDHYRDWIGKTYADLIKYYSDNSEHEIKIVYTDQYKQINKNIVQKYNPDIVVFFDTDTLRFARNFSYIFDMNVITVASSLDLFYFNQCRNCKYIKKCDSIIHFSKATRLLDSYRKTFPDKYINDLKGRYINTKIFKNYNLEKKYDILIYGTRNYINNIEEHNADKDYKIKYEDYYNKKLSNKHEFYPLRNKISKLLLDNKQKYNIYIINEACIYDAPIANEKLSALINQSYLTLATSSRADICMAKYFEIAGSYSGILGNIPSDYEKLFKNNIVEITEWMSDNKILNIIDDALNNKSELLKKIKRLGDIVQNNYNLQNATQDMDKLFVNIKSMNRE